MKSVEETKREKKIKEDLKQWEEFGVREQESKNDIVPMLYMIIGVLVSGALIWFTRAYQFEKLEIGAVICSIFTLIGVVILSIRGAK